MPSPEEQPILGWNSNDRRCLRRKKLLDGEEIEVRSIDEGFMGSWHSGTVIASKKRRCRSVEYKHFLSDDGTTYLVETVDVSEVVDGLTPDCIEVSGTFRGRLRPVPPKLKVDKGDLPYGLCVDMFTNEAWWEGVLLDHKNGSEERRLFFPDLGDEMNANVQSLRITQDWDEGTETWKCRGNWLFLDLIEKYRKDNYLPVSVKQIWYDIRDKMGFVKIQEWTCSARHLWEDLMLDVIHDNLRITIDQFLHDYNAKSDTDQEFELLKEASQAVNETNASHSGGVLVVVPHEKQFSCIDKDHKLANQECQSLSVLTSVSGVRSEMSYINGVIESSSKNATDAHKKMILSRKPGNWEPFDCVAKSCPQAVSSYIRTASQKVAIHVKKHLKHMGWTIECMVDEGGRTRFRYISPDGSLTDYSLRQACLILKQRDESLTLGGMAKPLSPPCQNQMYDTQGMMPCIVLALPACNRSIVLGDGRKLCAETLLECENARKSGGLQERKQKTDLRLKIKLKQKLKLRCNSKKDEVIVGLQNVNLSMRRGRTSRMLVDFKNRVTGRGKTRVSRPSKRVQRVITPTSRHHSPCSILSWLIDHNVVLPRENIRVRNQKNYTVGKEGKITREGIKCSCCRRIFTISGFEVHADVESCRAAANIFLDDGRSLLECQVEAYKTRKKAQPPDVLKLKLRQGENDISCSVCHYGGKLILCDGCPAAFHANCLGLEDVPDGDWFCASCCCGACGQFTLKDTSKYFKEEKLVSCKQCELNYHPSCLRQDGLGDSLDTSLGEKWFCHKDCEEIFVNLRELTGKPREVGVEKNLSWRLVKSLEPDTYGVDGSIIEAVAENYCKLSVALDVMHELFEPVKRRHVGGDLAEDVIFSRWSKHKRLNFSGFYTVLLERNDELVTVATVRILGKRVAEMPFIGTRFQHRQQGMCRVLMNELETVLIDLGVERLVLPAVPCVLSTWINNFGFTKITTSERKDFLPFTFLEFGKTIMCQKILIKNSLTDSVSSTVSLGEPDCGIVMVKTNSGSDDRSQVDHAKQHLEESNSAKNPTEGIKTHQERKENRIIKFYTRRRSKCKRLT